MIAQATRYVYRKKVVVWDKSPGLTRLTKGVKAHGYLSRDDVREEKLAKVRALSEIARARGQTMAQMALAWNLRHPSVTSVLVGASRVSQIEENVAALEKLAFTEEELEAIDRILAG
jgi:L-glyceraldehyde 3-phosphate reductase